MSAATDNNDLDKLIRSCGASLELMTIDQRVYKGLNNNFEELLLYLG